MILPRKGVEGDNGTPGRGRKRKRKKKAFGFMGKKDDAGWKIQTIKRYGACPKKKPNIEAGFPLRSCVLSEGKKKTGRATFRNEGGVQRKRNLLAKVQKKRHPALEGGRKKEKGRDDLGVRQKKRRWGAWPLLFAPFCKERTEGVIAPTKGGRGKKKKGAVLLIYSWEGKRTEIRSEPMKPKKKAKKLHGKGKEGWDAASPSAGQEGKKRSFGPFRQCRRLRGNQAQRNSRCGGGRRKRKKK